MELKKLIASWVRQARTEAGLSGDELAAKLIFELKVTKGNSKANISHWETEKHSPDLEQLLAIVRITGKSLPAEITCAMQGGKQPIEPSSIPVNYLERVNQEEMGMLSEYRLRGDFDRTLIRAAIGGMPISDDIQNRLLNKK